MIRRLDLWQIKSSTARSVSKLLGLNRNADLTLRGTKQESRKFSSNQPHNVEYIVLAGGGGGGRDAGGGGWCRWI